LKTVHQRLNPDGSLVVACNNDWGRAMAERLHWIGGYKDASGENVTTVDGLQALLGEHFSLCEPPRALQRELPSSSRSSRLDSMEITVWRLR
jgi:hypothetical protein